MSDCLFCKIINGVIPSSKIYEDENVVAFLDIFPFTKGHTVVIPKRHCETIFDFPDEDMGSYFSAVKRVAILIKNALNADGINIVQNNFSAAGQMVFHMHYHIIPRYANDGNPFVKHPKEQASPEYISEMMRVIKG